MNSEIPIPPSDNIFSWKLYLQYNERTLTDPCCGVAIKVYLAWRSPSLALHLLSRILTQGLRTPSVLVRKAPPAFGPSEADLAITRGPCFSAKPLLKRIMYKSSRL